MKILCICEHGNVRSVALAYLIKTVYKHEAIAIGVKSTSIETKQLLYDWADLIVFLDKNLSQTLMAEDYIPKFRILDVGEDIWHDPFAQGLQHKLLKSLKELNL